MRSIVDPMHQNIQYSKLDWLILREILPLGESPMAMGWGWRVINMAWSGSYKYFSEKDSAGGFCRQLKNVSATDSKFMYIYKWVLGQDVHAICLAEVVCIYVILFCECFTKSPNKISFFSPLCFYIALYLLLIWPLASSTANIYLHISKY